MAYLINEIQYQYIGSNSKDICPSCQERPIVMNVYKHNSKNIEVHRCPKCKYIYSFNNGRRTSDIPQDFFYYQYDPDD